MSVSAIKARWGLFGHVMRMAHNTPAQMAIDEYITPTAGWQGRPRTTLPTTLDNDLQQARLATFKNICIRQKSMAYPSPGNYESGTSETDSLIVRQQREYVTDDDDDDMLKMEYFNVRLLVGVLRSKQVSGRC